MVSQRVQQGLFCHSKRNNSRINGDSFSIIYPKINLLALQDCYKDLEFAELPRMVAIEQKWSQVSFRNKPFRGKRVLVNGHIDDICLYFIKLIIDLGCQAEVTSRDPLVKRGDAVSALKKSGIPYYDDGKIPQNKEYNFVFDCGGGVTEVISKIATIEQTFVPAETYAEKSKQTPVYIPWGVPLLKSLKQ